MVALLPSWSSTSKSPPDKAVKRLICPMGLPTMASTNGRTVFCVRGRYRRAIRLPSSSENRAICTTGGRLPATQIHTLADFAIGRIKRQHFAGRRRDINFAACQHRPCPIDALFTIIGSSKPVAGHPAHAALRTRQAHNSPSSVTTKIKSPKPGCFDRTNICRPDVHRYAYQC